MNFKIEAGGKVSNEFFSKGIKDFYTAYRYIKYLPYSRNKNKENVLTVICDNCGTCSTKHALLKILADENKITNVKLLLGIFKMNAINTPKIESILVNYNLSYIPEAHNYLRIDNAIYDATTKQSSEKDFINDLVFETEIQPSQITDYKVTLHKKYLQKWLIDNPSMNYSLADIWKIREECILALSV